MPAMDPIALPAPVWLFKGLSYLTLSLHFGALSLLLAGLTLAAAWNFWGHRKGSPAAKGASNLVAGKLPTVTTYVINLGVPPLLFAQVLYGRALYTSSVLIGAWWISVVFAIMIAYAVLYRINKLASQGKEWWAWSLISLPLFAFVGRLFSANMTLMLHPESWKAMYATNPHGTTFPHDPVATSRWLFVMASALALGALGTAVWSVGSKPSDDVRAFLRRWAGTVALVAAPVTWIAGSSAWGAQPEEVRAAIGTSAFHGFVVAFPIALALAALVGVGLLATARSRSWILPFAGFLPVLGALVSLVVVRDAVRDQFLSKAGFDVWQSPVNTNWTVVGAFLVALVAGLGVLGWIGSVVASAKPSEEAHVG
jgi:hypothetical protein